MFIYFYLKEENIFYDKLVMSEISAIIEKDTVVNSKRTEQKKQFQTNTNQSSEQINHPQYQQLDLANEIKVSSIFLNYS